ncbi:hypothetical protein GX51_06486 [Blastomyces parvus]|uniref:Uncharacterized protein n=1 Tax=Blastomyces parvus TaxID=2060905 RepID=A0A2B7WQY6_9EURO|nr:hypothetical protein GX51_06486 [Blastomyces parvus]
MACRTYVEIEEASTRITVESPVNGLSLDGEWCHAHFHVSTKVISLASPLKLTRGKHDQIEDFVSKEAT